MSSKPWITCAKPIKGCWPDRDFIGVNMSIEEYTQAGPSSFALPTKAAESEEL